MNKHKVYGVGINDYNGTTRINGVELKSYKSWKRMLERCYSEKFLKNHPTYIGCKVCDEWLYFSNFKKWFDENYRFDLLDIGINIHLDKDILSDNNNKIYSPDTCVFIPSKINNFLTNKKKNNKYDCIGVSSFKNKFKVLIKDFDTGKNKHIGYFDNISEAHIAYNNARNEEVKKVVKYMKNLGYDNNILDKIH